MARNQISVVISNSMKRWIDSYCSETGINASELLRLLVVREKRLQRLALEDCPDPPVRFESDDRASLTAYFATPHDVQEFDAYAQAIGLTRRHAAYLLLLKERGETWLDRALSTL